MCLESEVSRVLEWANIVAGEQRTSALRILIAFDEKYKQLKDVNKAKNMVEQDGGKHGVYN